MGGMGEWGDGGWGDGGGEWGNGGINITRHLLVNMGFWIFRFSILEILLFAQSFGEI